eukprot:354303-Prorocentrum_minimum.AAC.1
MNGLMDESWGAVLVGAGWAGERADGRELGGGTGWGVAGGGERPRPVSPAGQSAQAAASWPAAHPAGVLHHLRGCADPRAKMVLAKPKHVLQERIGKLYHPLDLGF